jgi:hypothetical protein
MAEIADWQRKNYKKVQSFADGGMPEFQAPPERLSLTEEERVKQEDARELSTIQDMGKEKKFDFSPGKSSSSKNLEVEIEPDRYQMPPAYQEAGRYTNRILAAAGLKDGGLVKGKR